MESPTFYDILGVERAADTRDLKTAYRRLARRYHPDVTDDPDGERKFKEVAEAYGTLRFPHKRTEYDDRLSSSRPASGWPPNHVIWTSWALWMYWWATWDSAWRAACNHAFVESDSPF